MQCEICEQEMSCFSPPECVKCSLGVHYFSEMVKKLGFDFHTTFENGIWTVQLRDKLTYAVYTGKSKNLRVAITAASDNEKLGEKSEIS